MTGACQFVLLHPSVQNQTCSCQTFHQNRSVPGPICDCGHQACYHRPVDEDRQRQNDAQATIHMLTERIERLEGTIKHERETRDTAIRRQRSDWEREVRILREALSPFYKSEQDMRQRLIEIEDRVEGNYDDQVRLTDKVVAIDDASMALEKRVEDVETSRTKRRKTSRQVTLEDSMTNGHILGDVRRMSSNPEVQSTVSSSRAISPNSITSGPEAEVPRSSGILNLVEMPRSFTHTTPPQPISQPRTALPSMRTSPLMREEARSSGFL